MLANIASNDIYFSLWRMENNSEPCLPPMLIAVFFVKVVLPVSNSSDPFLKNIAPAKELTFVSNPWRIERDGVQT